MKIKDLIESLPSVEVNGEKYYSFQAFAKAITFKYGYGASQLKQNQVNEKDYIKHKVEGAGHYKRLVVNKRGLLTFMASARLDKVLEDPSTVQGIKEEIIQKLLEVY